MNHDTRDVGALEAKTHLSELLRRAENGETFVIRRRGRPVARLVPYDHGTGRPGLSEIVGNMQRIRSQVEGPCSVRELIEEGRRA